MKQKVKFSILLGTGLLAFGAAAFAIMQNNAKLRQTNADVYQLTLNNTVNQLDLENTSCSIKTTSGYDVPLFYSGLEASEGNLAKLTNGAYIMNTAKIKAMSSITVNFTGELKISYAWEDTNMLVEENLESGVEYTFFDKSPSYFKLSNDSGVDVTLNSIDIKYTCEDIVKKVIKINYLMKEDSSLIADPTYLILDEGEIYGEEAVTGKGAITSDGIKYLPNRYWVGGKCEENKEINITYTPASIYDGNISTSLTGTGSAEDPYQINSAADLAYLESSTHGLAGNGSFGNVDTYYVLNTSIDMTGYDWVGICNRKSTTTSYSYFNANFDGQGYTIGGLTTPDNCAYTAIGFISSTNAATQVKNFTLEGNFAASSKRIGGGLSYYPRSTTFTNIYSYVDFDVFESSAERKYVASLIGSVSTGATVRNCESYGTVHGYNSNGGIAGSVSGTIENCINYGAIDGGQYSGGIAGDITGNVLDCINYGKVSNSISSSVGGVGGRANTNGIIEGCINYGEVESTFTEGTNGAQVGGIAGTTYKGKVCNSINYGYVHSTLKGAAGIVGWHTTSSTVYGCANAGIIESEAGNTTGSILGYCGSGSHAYGYTIDATEEMPACYNLAGAKVLGVTYPSEGNFIVVGINNNDGGASIKI